MGIHDSGIVNWRVPYTNINAATDDVEHNNESDFISAVSSLEKRYLV